MFYHIDGYYNGNYIIEHDIADVVDIRQLYIIPLHLLRLPRPFGTYILLIMDSDFNKIINKCIFPVLPKHNANRFSMADADESNPLTTDVLDENYPVVAIIIRTEANKDILTFLYRHKGTQMIALYPVGQLFDSKYSTFIYKLPNRRIKCYKTYDEYLKAINKNKAAREITQKIIETSKEELHDTIPTFSFTSPKFKILAIKKPTHKVSAKVGDVMYATIPCIIDKIPSSDRCWADIYVNGVKEKRLLLSNFQKLFTENFLVETL